MLTAEHICVVTPWLTQKPSRRCHCLLLLGLILLTKSSLEQSSHPLTAPHHLCWVAQAPQVPEAIRSTMHRNLGLSDGPCCPSERAASHFGGLLFAPHRVHPCQQATEEEGTVQTVCAWAYPRSSKANWHFLKEDTKTGPAGENQA